MFGFKKLKISLHFFILVRYVYMKGEKTTKCIKSFG